MVNSVFQSLRCPASVRDALLAYCAKIEGYDGFDMEQKVRVLYGSDCRLFGFESVMYRVRWFDSYRKISEYRYFAEMSYTEFVRSLAEIEPASE